MSDQRYNLRGVSASKEDVHNAIKNIDKGIFPKAFCKIIPDILGGDPEYCNIMHADGEILSGNNQENAAYPSGLCAERTTLFYAGARYPDAAVQILAIAAMKDGERVDLITPCGACRQVMLETEQRYNKPMKVLLCGKEEAYLVPSATALLPFCFSKSDLI